MEILNVLPLNLRPAVAWNALMRILDEHPSGTPNGDLVRGEAADMFTAIGVREMRVNSGQPFYPISRFEIAYPGRPILVFAPSTSTLEELGEMYQLQVIVRELTRKYPNKSGRQS